MQNFNKKTKFVFLATIFLGLLGLAQSSLAANNAQFVAQSVPETMTQGQIYQVSVTMKNTGDITWTGGHRLGSQNPRDNMTWGFK